MPSNQQASARLGGHNGLQLPLRRSKNTANGVPTAIELTGLIHMGSKSWTLAFAEEGGFGGLLLTENDAASDAETMASMDGASCFQHDTFDPGYEGHEGHDHHGGSARPRRGGQRKHLLHGEIPPF